ncbi:MAG: polysaccharide deacetylase family protein [Pseudomonadota bacterium]
MSVRAIVAIGLGLSILGAAAANATECPGNPYALGTSRVMTVDPAQYPRLGTVQYPETLPLEDKEVVLTFDDGPLPPYTNRILEILASECVKANYFLIGKMARGYPDLVKRIAAEGHTIGTHTQNHPLAFDRMSANEFRPEIEDGIASVGAALGDRKALAPFFRIPGLLRAEGVEDYLRSRGLTAWSADITGDDWKHISASEVVKRTISRLEENRRGIILLHDIQPATALALPNLLKELKARGYRVVLVKPTAPGADLIASARPAQPPVQIAAQPIVPPVTPTVPRPAPIITMAAPAPTAEPGQEAQAHASTTGAPAPRVAAKPAPAPVVRHMEQAAVPMSRSYEHLARPFTPRLKAYRSTELGAKPPFEPAPSPVRTQTDRTSSLRGPVVTDVAVNAQASASPADKAQISQEPRATASQLKSEKIAEPTGDLGMWPFEALKNVAQSTAR